MFKTTYLESVSSILFFEIGDPSGPMQNGIIYIVRLCIQPLYNPRMWQIVELLIFNFQLVQSSDCIAGVDFLSLIQIGQSQNLRIFIGQI